MDIKERLKRLRINSHYGAYPIDRDSAIKEVEEILRRKKMDALERAMNIIKENICDDGHYPIDGGIFNTKSITFGDEKPDAKCTLYKDDDIQVDVCYEAGYFEVFGLNEKEFEKLERHYYGLVAAITHDEEEEEE